MITAVYVAVTLVHVKQCPKNFFVLLLMVITHIGYSTNESLLVQNSLHQACEQLVNGFSQACNGLWLLYACEALQYIY